MSARGFHNSVGPWKVSEGEARGRTYDMDQEKIRLEQLYQDTRARQELNKLEGTQKG